MNRRHVYGLTAALTLIGLSMFSYKYLVLGVPLLPDAGAQVWTVQARIRFQAGQGSAKVDMQLPADPAGFTVLDENFIAKGFGLTTRATASRREASWALRRPRGKEYTLYYRAVVTRDRTSPGPTDVPPFPPLPQLEEPYTIALDALIDDVREHSADIATFTAEMLRRLNQRSPDEYVQLFVSDVRTPEERAAVATTLLAGARVPARIVHGVWLQDTQVNVQPVVWLEVHNGREWLYFDPATGNQRLPDDLLIWWRGDRELVSVEGGGVHEVELAVQRNVVDALTVAERLAEQRGSHGFEFSLFGLPIQTQAVYAVLLMVPLGALVIAFLRNVVGVKTFGTFMPVLVALAFRETQLFGGIVLFSLIVALGLSIRFYLEKLRLLLVPRLTVVLTVVVILMATVSIISHQLGIETGLSVALFPMVILTMVIERMSIVWEERGSNEAIQQGIGSLVVAAVAYLVMGLGVLEHLAFAFPELLLLVAAAAMLLGRYTGYRLSELMRFRAFTTAGTK